MTVPMVTGKATMMGVMLVDFWRRSPGAYHVQKKSALGSANRQRAHPTQ